MATRTRLRPILDVAVTQAAAFGPAGGGLNLRIALHSVDDLGGEAVGWLRTAYEASR